MELVTAGASAEVEVAVEFSFVPGSAGYFNPVTGAGEPPYGPEIDLLHVYWLYERMPMKGESVTGGTVFLHFGIPLAAIPDDIIEDIVNTIIENYNPADDAPERG